MNIIQTNTSYSSIILRQNLYNLLNKYPFLNVQTIGNSVLGTPLHIIKLGIGKKQIFYSSSIHANEWITSLVLMKFVEDYCKAYISKSSLYDYSINDLFNLASIYIMPMVNPDGVDLVTNALQEYNPLSFRKAKSISLNYSSIPFPSGWKANINGVDLNLQFPAGWEQAKKIKYSQGFTTPAPRDFVGFGPLTEPESLAIYNFTLSHNFDLVISFHTQGKEIYYQFQDYTPPESLNIANYFSDISGYTVSDTPYNSSFAGYKDWFIQEYQRPGFTIEAGIGTNPLPISQFDEIYNDLLGILVLAALL